jgi:hypothetical protein
MSGGAVVVFIVIAVAIAASFAKRAKDKKK